MGKKSAKLGGGRGLGGGMGELVEGGRRVGWGVLEQLHSQNKAYMDKA